MVRGVPGGKRGLSNWVIGLIFIIGIIIASLLAFTKELPWRQAYEVQAVFESASNVRVNAPGPHRRRQRRQGDRRRAPDAGNALPTSKAATSPRPNRPTGRRW